MVNPHDFDIMDAAGYGYLRVWRERHYILKLALVPILIKFASLIVLITMDMDNELLRQGLYLIPSDFAKGWLLAQLLRTLLMEERWPVILDGMPDEKTVEALWRRARGIVAATLAFVLMSMLGNFVIYLLLSHVSPDVLGEIKGDGAAHNPPTGTPLSPQFTTLFFAGLFLFFWGFRFLWVYIPFSVLMPLGDYYKKIGGMVTSFRLFALYLSCMTPAMLVAVMLSRFVYNLLGTGDDDMAGRFVAILISVFADFLVALVATTAVAWSLKNILPHAANAFADTPKKEEK